MNKHKMSKKLLATIMTFAMLITMFPSGVFAAPGDSGQGNTPAVGEIRYNPQTANGENGNIVVNKSVTPGENGTYNLTLEAYATNKVDTIKTTTPLDIVLVLDTSGSMDEKFGSGKKAPKKIEALRTAANSFIDSVDKQNQDIKNSDDKHRISIVKFADENIKDVIGNDFTNDHYNYTQQVIGFSDEAQSLKDAVNSLSPAGSTAADSGLEKTQSVLDDARENAKKIVIFFTDGDPNHGAVFEGFEFQRNVATKAINTAGSLKASGATIYTIGIFNGANPSDLNGDSNEYMNAVSSNYPQAIASYEDTWGGGKYNVTLGTRAPQNEDYYFAASDANGLNQVFQNISETITNETLKANPDATAVLTDTLSEYFTFPEGWTGDVTDKVTTVQLVKAEGVDSDGNIQWGQSQDVDGVTVTVEGKTISITGFDYKDNAVPRLRMATTPAASSLSPSRSKLMRARSQATTGTIPTTPPTRKQTSHTKVNMTRQTSSISIWTIAQRSTLKMQSTV